MPNTVNIGLERIQEIGFYYREPMINLQNSSRGIDFLFTNRLSISPNEEIVSVRLELALAVESAAEESNPAMRELNYEAVFHFKVKGLDFTTQVDAETAQEFIVLPLPVSATLVGAAYSTCRGIVFVRTGNSQLSNYLLPMTNPVTLIKDMSDRFRRATNEEAPAGLNHFVMTIKESASGEEPAAAEKTVRRRKK